MKRKPKRTKIEKNVANKVRIENKKYKKEVKVLYACETLNCGRCKRPKCRLKNRENWNKII